MPYSHQMTSRVLYSEQQHRHRFTLQAFEQFGTLCMHNLDEKYLTRQGFEPSGPTSELQPEQICWCIAAFVGEYNLFALCLVPNQQPPYYAYGIMGRISKTLKELYETLKEVSICMIILPL